MCPVGGGRRRHRHNGQTRAWLGHFYDINDACIVELRLERDLDSEPAFFLHFELEDLNRAQALFNEMASVVYDLSHPQTQQILLCCSCGMTTTFFAMKLNECATGLGLDYEFSAKPIEEAVREGSRYSAVLLAPQVGYQRKAVVEALPNTPVVELPGKVFLCHIVSFSVIIQFITESCAIHIFVPLYLTV